MKPHETELILYTIIKHLNINPNDYEGHTKSLLSQLINEFENNTPPENCSFCFAPSNSLKPFSESGKMQKLLYCNHCYNKLSKCFNIPLNKDF